MPTYCVAYNCNNRIVKNSGLSSHIFPKDPEMRRRWVVATKRKDFIPSNSSTLCGAHFEDSAFEIGGLRKLLKKDAVPTLFDFPAHLQPDPPKRRRVICKVKSDEADDCFPKKKIRKVLDDGKESTKAADETVNVSRGTSVFIKQEALEPDIEMEEGAPEETDPLDIQDAEPSTSQESNEDFVRKKKFKADPEEEQEILAENIKAEPLEIIDEQNTCPECGDEVWNLDCHMNEKHKTEEVQIPTKKEKQHASKKIKKSSQPATQTLPSTLLKVQSTTTMKDVTPSSSISTKVKVSAQNIPPLVSRGQPGGLDKGKSKQYLVLVPKNAVGKQSVILPVTGPSTDVAPPPPPPPASSSSLPSSATDSSDMFSVSLARFPENQRIAIKKKMLEVVEAVERLKINPEMIVIAHKAEVP